MSITESKETLSRVTQLEYNSTVMTDEVLQSECLTELLELMQIIDEHKEDIVTLWSKLNAADEDELTVHLTVKLNDQTKQLEILKTKEIALKTVTCNILSQRNIAAKSTNDVISSPPDPEISFDTHKEPTKVELRPQSRFKFQLPPQV